MATPQEDQERDMLAVKIRGVFDSFTETTTVEEMRAGWETLFADSSNTIGAVRTPIEDADFRGCWITAPEAADAERVLVYMHGGGYVIGSLASYGDFCERLSQAAKARVLFVDYRRAPENTFPAASDDGVAAYLYALQQGTPAQRIAVAGDSAGGAMTLAVMLETRAAGLPLPACGVPISPWIDGNHTGESFATMDAVEPMCHKATLANCLELYLGDGPHKGDTQNPLVSPLAAAADLAGLPPLFVTVGGYETLLDDARRLEAKIKAAGGDVVLKIYPKQFHVFQAFSFSMAEAQRATEEIGQFVMQHTS